MFPLPFSPTVGRSLPRTDKELNLLLEYCQLAPVWFLIRAANSHQVGHGPSSEYSTEFGSPLLAAQSIPTTYPQNLPAVPVPPSPVPAPTAQPA